MHGTSLHFRLLSKLEVMRPEVPGILVLDCLELFQQVVEGCFSWELVADFKEKIEAFTLNFSSLISYAKV